MRIENRIRELSALPSTMGEGGLEAPFGDENSNSEDRKENQTPPTLDSLSTSRSRMLAHAPGKLRAIIELKALRVRKKQWALRVQVVERLAHGTLLPLDRKDFRRPRRPTQAQQQIYMVRYVQVPDCRIRPDPGINFHLIRVR